MNHWTKIHWFNTPFQFEIESVDMNRVCETLSLVFVIWKLSKRKKWNWFLIKKRKEKKREHFVVRINFIESHSMLRIVFSVHYFDFISTRMYRVRYFTFIMLLLPTNSTLKQKFNCSKWNESEYKHQALALKIQKEKSQRYGKYNKIAELNKRQGWQNSVIFRINKEQKRKQKCEKKEQTNECLKSKGIFTIDALHHNCDSSTVHRTEVEREGSKQCNIKSWNGILPQDNG